jgi:phage-related tail fiber protein
MAENRYEKPVQKGVNAGRQNSQNKFVNQKLKTSVKSKTLNKNRYFKATTGSSQKWVQKAANNVNTATSVSAANQKGAANNVDVVNNVSTVPKVSTATKISAANNFSTASIDSTATSNSTNNINTASEDSTANLNISINKVSAADEVSTAKLKTTPIITTKFSSHEILESNDFHNPKVKEFAYFDANGQPKTTLAWVSQNN